MTVAKVYVTLKEDVLDPQGKAVKQSLEALGFRHLRDVRVGKFLELTFENLEPEMVREEARRMCERLLANPVIENYRVEVG